MVRWHSGDDSHTLEPTVRLQESPDPQPYQRLRAMAITDDDDVHVLDISRYQTSSSVEQRVRVDR